MRTIRYGVARYSQKLVRSSKSWAGAAVAAELFEANPVAIIQSDSIQPTAMPDPSATSLNLRRYFSGAARASFLNLNVRRRQSGCKVWRKRVRVESGHKRKRNNLQCSRWQIIPRFRSKAVRTARKWHGRTRPRTRLTHAHATARDGAGWHGTARNEKNAHATKKFAHATARGWHGAQQDMLDGDLARAWKKIEAAGPGQCLASRDYRRHALQTIPPNHGPRRAVRALPAHI